MYLSHFKLRDLPFRLTPDTEYLFLSSDHARAKSYMEYTVWNREGFVVITGEVGAGKTTLVKQILSELDENVIAAHVFQTQLNDVEFLQAVLVEFGFKPFQAPKAELLDTLNSFLIEQFQAGRQIVLIVDDAHNLGLKTLEEIRMLSGLETSKEKIVHIMLVGQPQLNDLLDRPELEQLRQRVRLRYHIKPLSQNDTKDYIQHRLKIAGAEGEEIFDASAYPIVHEYTGGLPRLINSLCDTALVVAYADGQTRVSKEVLRSAIEELQWPTFAAREAASKRKPKGRTRKRDDVLESLPDLIARQTLILGAIDQTLSGLNVTLRHLPDLAERLTQLEQKLDELSGDWRKRVRQ